MLSRFLVGLGCKGCIVILIAAISGCGGGAVNRQSTSVSLADAATAKKMAAIVTGKCVKSGNTPCLITAGGTYSGTWVSTDPTAPVVIIATTDPVVIQNCVMTGASDLVNAWSTLHTNVSINHCIGYVANPIATQYGAAGITMDGKQSDTAATATAFVNIYSNQIVSHSGNGINLAAGHDTKAYSNRIVGTSFYKNTNPQQPYFGWGSVNVTNNYSQPAWVFFNNTAIKNVSANQITWAYASAPLVAKAGSKCHHGWDKVSARDYHEWGLRAKIRGQR